MIASLKGYGRIARTLLAALGALLVLGIIGSLLMGVHARRAAQAQIVHQAQTITDSSLTLAFTPDDLTGPASAERANQLTAQIQSIVIDPSDFDSVTLYSPEGTILYSTATSRIGTQLPGEKDSIKEALRGVPLTTEFDEVSIRRNPNCPVCGENPTITEYIDYVEFCQGRPAHA